MFLKTPLYVHSKLSSIIVFLPSHYFEQNRKYFDIENDLTIQKLIYFKF